MLVSSRAVGFTNVASEELSTCKNESPWNRIQLISYSMGYVDSDENTQETHAGPWIVGACARSQQINHFYLNPSVAFTSENVVLPKRPLYTMEEGRMVIDPSAMDVNVPYCLDVFGETIWALKDDSDDVIFFELGE